MSIGIDETIDGDTIFGPVTIVGTPADLIELGDSLAGGPWPVVGTNDEAYHVYMVEETQPTDGGRLWIATYMVHCDYRLSHNSQGALTARPDEPVLRIAATRYDNDSGRELHHEGQLHFGGLLVCALRDAAAGFVCNDNDFDAVHDVFDYAVTAGLIRDDDIALTEEGNDLLEALEEVYPFCADWRDRPADAVCL